MTLRFSTTAGNKLREDIGVLIDNLSISGLFWNSQDFDLKR